MPRMSRRLGAALAAVLLTAVAACSSDSGTDSPDDTGDRQGAAATTTDDATPKGADGPDAAQDEPTDGSAGAPSATWDDADGLSAGTSRLKWKTRPLQDKGPAASTRRWTGASDSLGKKVTITGPGKKTLRYKASNGRVQGLEMQWPWAVVYAGGSLTGGRNQSQKGEIAVFDLRDGTRRMVGDEGSAPPPAMAGSVSVHDGKLAYATGTNRNYCLATLSLETLDGQQLRCAEPLKEGFTQFRLTSAGFGYTSFDDRRPNSCMTLKTIRDNDGEVLKAAKNCVGWEVVPGENSDLWLQVRNPNRVEQAHAYARTSDDKVVNLGPALSGTTTWCGGATYFIRPAATDGRADDLMRWSPETGLDVVWTPKGSTMAFVFAPHCGGSTITLPGFDRKQNPKILTAATT